MNAFIMKRSVDPVEVGAGVAEQLHWFKQWDKVLDWECAVVQVVRRRRDQPHVQLPGPTCAELATKQSRDYLGRRARRKVNPYLPAVADRSSKFANVLKWLGIQKGDRVAIYMGMVPAAQSRCLRARASAPRTPLIFGGFSANAW